MRLTIYILVYRTLGSLNLCLLDSGLQLILGRLHQWRVESTTHLQRQCTLGTSSLQLFAGLIDSLYVAADDQLAGVVIVSANHDITLAVDTCADLFYFLVGQTNDGSHC